MKQAEKREYLIKTLLTEQPGYKDMEIPEETGEQKRLLRSLFNVRMQHMPVSITGKQSARRISGSRPSVSMVISAR